MAVSRAIARTSAYAAQIWMAAPISAGARTLRCHTPKTEVDRRMSSEFNNWLFAEPLQCVGKGGATYARNVSASSMVMDCTAARAIVHNRAKPAVARSQTHCRLRSKTMSFGLEVSHQ